MQKGMYMDDLMEMLYRLNEELSVSIKQLRQNGNEFAKAENEYQIIKAQNVLRMKDAGASMTEINLSIKGQMKVAEAMLKRDIAKVMYEANQEHINTVKLRIRVLDSQINREWHSNE